MVKENLGVSLVGMYLTVDAKLYWRSRHVGDTRVGQSTFNSWEELKKKFREQFLPCNTGWVARVALKKLKQTGTIQEYVKGITSLLLDINDMSEEDKLSNFLTGLRPWVRIEVRRQGAKDLPTVIAYAEALVDYQISMSNVDKELPR